MGLGSNHVLNEIYSCSPLNPAQEESMPTKSALMSEDPAPMSKGSKAPIVLRLQNKKGTSRSERFAKGKSASELWSRKDGDHPWTRKDSAKKQRPSSQFYDIEEFDLKAQEANLAQLSSAVSSSQPSLCASEQVSSSPQPVGLMVSRHLPLHTSTPHLTPADSLLQRFRKSFAVRFKKKADDAKAKPDGSAVQELGKAKPDGSGVRELGKADDALAKSSRAGSVELAKPEVVKGVKAASPSDANKELQLSSNSSSNSRKRNRRKTNWRASVFYDSVDSVFDLKPGVNKSRVVSRT